MKIAILYGDGSNIEEMIALYEAFKDIGRTFIVSSKETIRTWKEEYWSGTINKTVDLATITPENYDCLYILGGELNDNSLRKNPKSIELVRHFFKYKKPVGCMCHAGSLLISADVVDGLVLTSCDTIKEDLINAGAIFSDQIVVVDDNLISSRKPNSIKAFIPKVVKHFSAYKDFQDNQKAFLEKINEL
jgi:protease I